MNEETQEAIDRLNEIIGRLKDERFTTEEVRALLGHASILVRVNALKALSRRARDDESLIDDLADAARDATNSTRLLGPTVAQVAVACLLEVGTERAKEEARRLVDEWPEPDRSDLLWLLQSQSLSLW